MPLKYYTFRDQEVPTAALINQLYENYLKRGSITSNQSLTHPTGFAPATWGNARSLTLPVWSGMDILVNVRGGISFTVPGGSDGQVLFRIAFTHGDFTDTEYSQTWAVRKSRGDNNPFMPLNFFSIFNTLPFPYMDRSLGVTLQWMYDVAPAADRISISTAYDFEMTAMEVS